MSGEFLVVSVSAVATGEVVVTTRCLRGEVMVGDWVGTGNERPESNLSQLLQIRSITAFTSPMTDADLDRAGRAPGSFKDFGYIDTGLMRQGDTALIHLVGPSQGGLTGDCFFTTS